MTAVEYYNQEIKELFNQFQDGEISGNMFHVQRLASLTKANEMFEQQITRAYYIGEIESQIPKEFKKFQCSSEYYNETFKNTKK